MDTHKPLFWHQGLFLQPHHFQLQDQYVQSLLLPYQKFIQPHLWGVAQASVSSAALGNRSFELVKGEFLFPDGTHVSVPGNGLIEPRSFEDDWIEGDRPLKVYLGLKKWDASGENVTVLPDLQGIGQVATRFVTKTDPDELDDLYQPGPKAQIKSLNFVLRVFWETEKDQLGDYLLIPVAQIERQGEELKFSGRYVPPSLNMNSAETLLILMKEIRDQLASRARQLEEYKTQKGVHTAEFGTRDMVFVLALRTLNRYVPLLYHYLESPQVHPWPVFGLLRQLIGELSSFSDQVNVLGDGADGTSLLQTYDHQDLGGCFRSAQSLITQLLDAITSGPEYVIRLVYDGTYFAAELPPAIFEGRNRFYLVLDTEADPAGMLQSIETVVKLGARESLPILIARALPGVGMEHLAVPPQELPRRSHSLYFQIDHHSDQWSPVEKGHNIALYWDDAPEDINVEMMVVGRS
ncbi:MAG: type VI secretion system baseplate subunit TssK [Deltaproteobacteria bacterium]|nr:MAG: type VI secretion system baseplate subunit TssK [Deltaproteobacteria bacterium]